MPYTEHLMASLSYPTSSARGGMKTSLYASPRPSFGSGEPIPTASHLRDYLLDRRTRSNPERLGAAELPERSRYETASTPTSACRTPRLEGCSPSLRAA